MAKMEVQDGWLETQGIQSLFWMGEETVSIHYQGGLLVQRGVTPEQKAELQRRIAWEAKQEHDHMERIEKDGPYYQQLELEELKFEAEDRRWERRQARERTATEPPPA